MQIKDILREIEKFAPLPYQEKYDNCGLQTGDASREATGALLTLDVTEAVIDEAIAQNANLVIAHHPLIFSGLKSLTGRSYVERTLLKAIRNDVAVYAAHTNLDNMQQGVNHKIAERLGLKHTKILAPVSDSLYKLYTYVPEQAAGTLLDALFAAGAGQIGEYSECSFTAKGKGSFKPSAQSNPVIRTAGGSREAPEEVKLELIVPKHLKSTILQILKQNHPYEEVAYELIRLENENQTVGAGLTGELDAPMEAGAFLAWVKKQMKTACIRHTPLHVAEIKKVAVCGGSGSFLLPDAIKHQADIFITGDFTKFPG